MPLDALVAIVVVLGLITGWLSGWLPQIGRLGAILLAALLARLVTVPVGSFLASTMELNPYTAVAVGFGLPLVLLSVVLWILLRRTVETSHSAAEAGTSERFVGMLFGAVKNLVVLYLVGIVLLTHGLGGGGAPVSWDDSTFGRTVLARNFLDELTAPVRGRPPSAPSEAGDGSPMQPSVPDEGSPRNP